MGTKQSWPRLLAMVAVGVGFVGVPSLARAQTANESNWSVDVGAGGSPTVGAINNRLSTGWNINVRGGYQFTPAFELFGEFGYNGLGVTDQVLSSLQVPSGNAGLMSLTAGPMWRFPLGHRVEGYLLGGVGWYRRRVEFTQPTVNVIDVVDPWWGYVGPVFVPADQVLGSVTRNAFGGNAGAGVSVPLGHSGTSLFAEVRYHIANTKPTTTAVVPVSVGLRWGGRHVAAPPS